MPRSTPTHRSRRATIALAAAVAASPILALACSNADTNTFANAGGGGSASSGIGNGGASVGPGTGGAGGGGIEFDGGKTGSLAITPINPTLKVELPLMPGQTVQFSCVDGASQPVAGATWTLSKPELGTISNTGLFTPSGKYAGTGKVRCATDTDFAETTITIVIHAVDNPGMVTMDQQNVLKNPQPGASDPSWTFLYPYDKTVFPKGILPPEIHLTQGGMLGGVFYVHIVSPQYEYEGWFNANPSTTQLQMSQDAWDALTNSAAGKSVDVQVSKIANGQKVGPIFRSWILANGSLHGTIYYNTYDSPLAQSTGAMMRIKGNSPTPEVLVGNCTVCHSISSDGSTAAAANHSGPGGIFDLSTNPPTIVWQDSERAAFAALYPKNGEVFVVNGAPGGSWPPNTPGTSGTWASELRTKSGMVIPNSGIESYYAQSPVFSHDGTMLAFTDRKNTPGYPSTLALLHYDEVSQKFSNYEVLGTPPAGYHFAWPAFTPDGKYVLYQHGKGDDLATWSGNTGKIYAVDVATKQITYLMNLNGDGYVPQGARDMDKDYEPTIAPIASGGYFWVMFTSRRTYGNKLTGDQSQTKRLWVSALDPNAPPGQDFSHPAFYIAGQELTSGNSRGFWALDPCKKDGDGCATGDECCTGFCNAKGDPPQYLCGPPDGTCSKEFESCQTKSDCCDPSLDCIGGKCSQLPPN